MLSQIDFTQSETKEKEEERTMYCGDRFYYPGKEFNDGSDDVSYFGCMDPIRYKNKNAIVYCNTNGCNVRTAKLATHLQSNKHKDLCIDDKEAKLIQSIKVKNHHQSNI